MENKFNDAQTMNIDTVKVGIKSGAAKYSLAVAEIAAQKLNWRNNVNCQEYTLLKDTTIVGKIKLNE